MKYKTCQYLATGIEFRYNAIALCNRVAHEGGGDIVVEYYDDLKSKKFSFDAKKYLEKRNEVIITNQKSDLFPKCKGCIEIDNFQDREIEELKISNIVLHHWTKCNSNCVYCYSSKQKKYFNKRKSYKFLPILKSLINDNLIEYGGIVNWAGGEISCLDEFNKILKILDKFDYFSIFNSSGIKYEKAIAEHLKNKKGMLIISLDSGFKNTHKKIKQVNSYSKVWNNVEKYIKASYQKAYVNLKYIILPNINDNKEEILKFLEKSKFIGVEQVIFDLDLYYFNDNRNNIRKEIIDLFYYAKNKAEELGLTFLLYQNAALLFSQGRWYDDEMKKMIFGMSDIDKVVIPRAIYSIETNGNLKKYYSIESASKLENIEYVHILNNCNQKGKMKISFIKNKTYVYADQIEENNKIDKVKLTKILSVKETNLLNKLKKFFP